MRPNYSRPVTTRSSVVLEMGYELARNNQWPFQRAMVTMQPQGGGEQRITLFGSDSSEAISLVASGQVQLAIINPAEPLTLAVRGAGPFKEPIPLRAIAVIPSLDAFAFAVSERTGLKRLEDIRDKRYPLRVSLRGQRDHCNHFFTEQVLGALGFSLEDIVGWGGEVRYDPGLPHGTATSGPDIEVTRLDRARSGEIDAIFDEAVRAWTPAAIDAGMRLLSLDEPFVQRLEAMGFRRSVIPAGYGGKVPADVLTLDFSGWPIYTHANVADVVVIRFCEALDAAKGRIPLEDSSSLPLERMCRDCPEGPLDIPLHPAAERFWRGRGYL